MVMLNYYKKQEILWEKSFEKNNHPWENIKFPKIVMSLFLKDLKKHESILDYGCGTGEYVHFFLIKKLNITCADISNNALKTLTKRFDNVKTIQASTPNIFVKKKIKFDAIFAWGVMHHIDKKYWDEFFKSFNLILKKKKKLLVVGHSIKNEDFNKGYRLSPTTGLKSYAIDEIYVVAEKTGFNIKYEGEFKYVENCTNKERILKWFIFEKK